MKIAWLSLDKTYCTYNERFLQVLFNPQLTVSAFNESQNNPQQQTTQRKFHQFHQVATKQPNVKQEI